MRLLVVIQDIADNSGVPLRLEPVSCGRCHVEDASMRALDQIHNMSHVISFTTSFDAQSTILRPFHTQLFSISVALFC